MDVDFLLVGQGIAGIALAHRLMNLGKTVHIIDQAHKNNSSRVAAGLFNPITGRNMVKTWMADQLFPEIQPFYSGLESRLGVNFFYSSPIYRPFASIEEQNEWMGRSGEAEFQGYIKDVKQSSLYPEVNDPYGGLLLEQSGYVDLNTLMDAFTSLLREKGIITDEAFDEGLIELMAKGIRYKNITAAALVYTNGLGALNSRFFDWLPLKPNKGELLVLDQDFAPAEIINRGIFRISLPDRSIKVGSTYSNNELSPAPTVSAREELLGKLAKLMKIPVKSVVAHKAGIRPTTIDRRPILGKHPHHDHVYIFNGLGSKGVSLAPYFSKVISDFLIFEKEPPKEVNISRFFKYI
jgi:glycine oxidase